MSVFKKVLIGGGAVVAVVVVAFVVCIGPWPTYTAGFENAAYYKNDLAMIDKNAQLNKITDSPGHLQAGWGDSFIRPEIGTPMAGYGARHNIKEYLFGDKPKGRSTGMHDDLKVKALALSDGQDTAVIVSADLLLVPPNVAETVRQDVAKKIPQLTANNIYFGASHTHDSVGGWGEGLAAFITGGKYDPRVPVMLSDAFTSAIIEAYNNLAPAKMAHGFLNAEKFIHNRARKADVDSHLSYLVVEKDDGKRCILINYSAHPTTVGDKFLEFTAEYPGFLQSTIEKALPNTQVDYLGGSLGSSGPNAPEGPSDIARAQAMGEELAKLFMTSVNMNDLKWETNVTVAAVGVPIEPPPFQMRVAQNWRVSPILPKILNVPHAGWMHMLRAGNLVLAGMPGDFSGEISLDWKKWAADKGYDLWTSSFCAAYLGYISPDKYYNDPNATKEYETGMMSWTGPHQEAFFTALMKHMVDDLGKPAAK